ncbi:MAG: hypothetical protein AB8G16_11840, partial [Gammaproteobacteria bacterium]
MTDHDDDLDLKALWQSTPPVDLNELLNHVDAERRRMRNLLWFETLGTVFGIACIWLYYKIELLTNPMFGIGVALAAVACQAWMWLWRRGQWNAVSQAPLDLLELQLRRARTGLRIGRYYAWGTPIAAVLGALLSTTTMGDGHPLEVGPLVRLVIIVGLLALLGGLTWFGVRLIR